MLKFFKNVIGSLLAPNPDISTWYVVSFDDDTIWRESRPPRGEGFSDSLRWADISRIVFEASSYAADDTIYIFTHLRPESYAIPSDAKGGKELWNEIVRRGMFDEMLAVEAMLSEGGYFVWPPVE